MKKISLFLLILILSVSCVYGSYNESFYNINKYPILQYKLNNNLFDNFNILNGTPYNIQYSPAIELNGTFFNGTNAYFSVNNSLLWNSTNKTISLWYNSKYLPGGSFASINGNGLISKDIDAWEIFLKNDTIRFRGTGLTFNKSGTLNSELNYVTPLNKWNFLTLVIFNNTIKWFINGSLMTSDNYSGSLSSNNQNITIGKRQGLGETNSYFNGTIDDIRYYNITLSNEEIYFLYRGYTSTIDFFNQQPLNNTLLSTDTYFNVSSTGYNQTTCNLYINGNPKDPFTLKNNSITQFLIEMGDLNQNYNTINVTCPTFNFSEQKTYFVNTRTPNITQPIFFDGSIWNNLNLTQHSNTTTLNLSFSVYDLNLYAVNYSIYNRDTNTLKFSNLTNYTIPQNSRIYYNFTINLSSYISGNYSLNLFVLDGRTGNINTTQINYTFQVFNGKYINFNYPSNAIILNSSFYMNFTLNNFLTFPLNCSIYINDVYRNYTTYNLNGLKSEYIHSYEMIQGLNNLSVNCSGTIGNTSVYYDIITPNYILNNNNFFDYNNNSRINQYIKNERPFNITFYDDLNLFGYSVNMTYNGNEIFYNDSTNINQLNYTYYFNGLNTTPQNIGIYYINLIVADGHTKNKIENYDVSELFGELTFKTPEQNEIKIKGLSSINGNAIKNKDRYNFEFNYLFTQSEYTFEISSNNKLFYLENSKYKSHFVIWNEKTKSGNWIDFEGVEGEHKIKFNKDNSVTLTIKPTNNKNKIEFKSIGSLNINNVFYSWYQGNYNLTYRNPEVTLFNSTFVLKLDYNNNYITSNNLNAKFFYNGTEYPVTKNVYSDHINYTTTLKTSINPNNYTFYFNVSVIQGNYNYTFLVNDTQRVLKSNLQVTYKDEITNEIINYTTIYSTLFNNNYTTSATTTNGIGFYTTLDSGLHTLLAYANNYPQSSLIVNIINESQSVTMYLLNQTTTTQDVIFYSQNYGLEPIQNARFQFFRRYNNTLVLVHDYFSDGFGIFKAHLDTTNEYSLIISANGYITQNLLLKPVLTTYKISLSKQLINTSTIYSDIAETLTPINNLILVSNTSTRFQYIVLDSKNLLQSMSISITSNKNINCLPSCYSELNNSNAGGSIFIDILLNETQNLEITTNYKRNGNDNIIKTFSYSVINEIPMNITALNGFTEFKNKYNNSVVMIVITALIQTIVCLAISQLGVFGLAMLPILIMVTAGLGIFGLISPMITIIMCVWGIFIYFLGRGS